LGGIQGSRKNNIGVAERPTAYTRMPAQCTGQTPYAVGMQLGLFEVRCGEIGDTGNQTN